LATQTIKKCVIPAAGFGTRLRPATKIQPKEMLPVGRKPTIQYVVEEAIAAGLKSILIITGRMKRAIADHFDLDFLTGKPLDGELDYERLGVKFFFVRQAQQTGLADAVAHAEAFVGDEPFVVCLGDTIIGEPEPAHLLRRLMDTHLRREATATVAAERVRPQDVSKYGILKPVGRTGAEFQLADLIEKPAPEHAPSRFAIASRYVFNPSIFNAIRAVKTNPPGKGGEYQLTDAMRHLLRNGDGIHRALEATRLFPYDYIEMINVAEESGSMPDTFGRLARNYFEKADNAIKALTVAFGWLIWVVVAGVIIYYIFIFAMKYISALSGIGGIY